MPVSSTGPWARKWYCKIQPASSVSQLSSGGSFTGAREVCFLLQPNRSLIIPHSGRESFGAVLRQRLRILSGASSHTDPLYSMNNSPRSDWFTQPCIMQMEQINGVACVIIQSCWKLPHTCVAFAYGVQPIHVQYFSP